MTRASYLLALLAAGIASGVLLATDPVSRVLLSNSILLALGSCSIAVPLGTLLAVVIARTDVAGRHLD